MLNSIGLANPGREALPRRDPAALRELGVPLWVSVGGFSARSTPRPAPPSAVGRGCRGDRAEPLLPERRRGAGERGRDRRRPAAPPLPCRSTRSSHRPPGTSPRRPRPSRRPGRTASRSSTPSAGSPSTSARCCRRSSAAPAATPAGAETGRARGRLRLRSGRRDPDRRHGRSAVRARRARADRARRERRRARHDPLLRPRRTRPNSAELAAERSPRASDIPWTHAARPFVPANGRFRSGNGLQKVPGNGRK
jgi:hypothetical protein